jgi:UDP-N-acetylglucosamine--N-acetylmuramyl-(pentapeptide) pyrophosphoryl-undecaprenol N-acetylglucosamine transferase
MSRPVYIVCGGTGGHLSPGVATAQRFLEKGIPVELVVSEKEIDSRLLQSYEDIPYRRAKGSGFSLSPIRFLVFCYNALFGSIQSLVFLRRERPVAIIAFGGFLSFSYVFAGWILKIPVVLHEANRKVGKSIRTLSGMADRIYLPEGVALAGVEPNRIRRTGMPIRREVRHLMKDQIREHLGIPGHVKVLTVVGGSQGAKALNEWVERRRKSLAAEGIWVFLVTGPGKQSMPELEEYQSEQGEWVQVRTFAFHGSLHELFCASDIVVSRAGAGTIAELIECLTPSILVPYPHAADQHQLSNAQDLERRGGCIVLDQDNLKSLYREVLDIIYNDWLLNRMRKNLRSLIHEDSAEKICQYVMDHCMESDDVVEQAEEGTA